jgi:hypothetical protein
VSSVDPPHADEDLPLVDEHRVLVHAAAPAVWDALTSRFTRPRLAAAGPYADLVGAAPRRSSGRFPDEGATLPGFAVAEVVPMTRLLLTGRHRFSRYALTLTLDEAPDATVLRACTRAEFPGPGGWAYRRLVIGSGAHRILVGGLLRGIRRQAEGT